MKKIRLLSKIAQPLFFFAIFILSSCQKHELNNDELLKSQKHDIANSSKPEYNEVIYEKGENIVIGDYNIRKYNGKYYLENDMILSETQIGHLKNVSKSNKDKFQDPKTKAALLTEFIRVWPDNKVNYIIDSNVPNQSRIIEAISTISSIAPLQFIPGTTGAAGRIVFRNADVNNSEIGFQGGTQDINLTESAGVGTVMHEIFHALGVFHEQSRIDRDNFVTVNYNNIQNNKEHNFTKYNERGFFGIDLGNYETNSIMHYGSFDFSNNDLPTITRKDGSTFSANRSNLSQGDIDGINYLYGQKYYIKYRTETIDQSYTGNEYYSQEYRNDLLLIRVFQDQACTIPVTLTHKLRVKIFLAETNYYSDGIGTQTAGDIYIDLDPTAEGNPYWLYAFESNATYELGNAKAGSVIRSAGPSNFIKYELKGGY